MRTKEGLGSQKKINPGKVRVPGRVEEVSATGWSWV